jgi:hypothetical protein
MSGEYLHDSGLKLSRSSLIFESELPFEGEAVSFFNASGKYSNMDIFFIFISEIHA